MEITDPFQRGPAPRDSTEGNIGASRHSLIPRVAFFTDSFHEANGVALTSRQFANFARQHFYPFLSVHAGPQTAYWKRGSFETYELGSGRWNLQIEHDLAFDLGFFRHRDKLRAAVAQFRPDLIHVTGPSHLGILGALIAHDLGVPLVASWHTNVHEYGARRLQKTLRRLPPWSRFGWEKGVTNLAERAALRLTLRFYELAKMLFAPNSELVDMLAEGTHRPVHLMQRGIDVNLFHPERRCAQSDPSRPFTIGYVGRLSAEKNVRIFVEIEAMLRSRGLTNHRFALIGEGSERSWLRQALPNADFPGLLDGEALADAYARMDAFVFPSETDTFGNVVLEAMASGVPVLVSNLGGPKHLVEPGVNGFIAGQNASAATDFADGIARWMSDEGLRAHMGGGARDAALNRRWATVFEKIYRQYEAGFNDGTLMRPKWAGASSAGNRKWKAASPVQPVSTIGY